MSIYTIDGTEIEVSGSGVKRSLKVSSMGRISDAINSAVADGSEYTLCGVRNKYTTDSTPPVTIGWLYERSPVSTDGCELWYSPNHLDNPSLLTTMSGIKSNDTLRSFAVSPKYGDVITLKMDERTTPYVYDATNNTTVAVTGFDMKPIGWLASSGCEFGLDENDEEFFMFGEYTGSAYSAYQQSTVNVWKVTYPYTERANWSIVLTLTRTSAYNVSEAGKVWHFHTVMRDPYTDIWYATTGDVDESITWWYSADYGANWTKIVTGTDWASQTARVLNLVFDEDYIWWANDYGTNHSVNRVARDSDTGVVDPDTHTVVANLNNKQSTYATCLLNYPHGLLMLDRVDAAFASSTDEVTVQFYSFDDSTVYDLWTFKRQTDAPHNYFGFRCKVYTIRQSPYDTRIGIGWDIGHPNYIDMPGNEDGEMWTAFIEVV